MFMNPGCTADKVADVYAHAYLKWRKAVHNQSSAETIHRHAGAMCAAEKCLELIIGPNLAGQVKSQREKFIDKNFDGLSA
jgi:hypothetical protein